MKERIDNKIKDININLINNYNSDITKNQIPVPNIHTNLNANSFSQENIFNELMNSINCQESKNNSSFSESINSNQENPSIIMNKDQLYHIFFLFQKLINQNQNMINNRNNNKNEESTINTNNTYINNINSNNNIIKDFHENNNNYKNKKINNRNTNLIQNLKKNKSDTNIIEQKEILKEKEENKIMPKNKETHNKIIEAKNNKKNPYDDIPIKLNTTNFLELVEKKLADEENKNNNLNLKNKNYIRKVIGKVKRDKTKNKNNNPIIKEERTKTYRESINGLCGNNLIKRNNNKSLNYSFDKEETKLIFPENKNTIENSTSIIDNMNTIFIKGELPKKKIIEYKISNFDFMIKNCNKSLEDLLDKCNEKEQILNKKIKEMNKEIIKLKEEQSKVNKIKLEYEKYTTKLNNDIYQLSQKREEFEKFRKNELIKIKNNKKNIMSESKNIKEIKNKNQELINKSKKDKEIIEKLKQQINKLEMKLKENGFNTNIIKERRFKSPECNFRNNLSESKSNIISRINTHYKTQTHQLTDYNNTMGNYNNNNNILYQSTDEKFFKDRINVSLKKNNLTNKNKSLTYKIMPPKENEIMNHIYNKTKQNESSGYLSISQRILENSMGNIKPKRENKNEKLLFSPIACKTSIGFGLRKISIKLNTTPKQNMRLRRKIYENKHNENQILDTNSEEKEETNEKFIHTYNNENSIKNNIIKDIYMKTKKNFPLNNIFLPENKRKLNLKAKKQKRNEKEILNKSDKNTKIKKNKIINTNKSKINKEEYDFIIPKKYLNKEYKLIKTIKENDKTISIFTNDKKAILYNDGTRKEIYKKEHQIIYYTNGDIKQIFSDGKISYLYNDSKKVETTLNNGIKIYKLNNGQIEKHFPDGTKLIIFNDDTEKYIYNDGSEETYFSDGFVKKDKDKDIIMEKTLEEDN